MLVVIYIITLKCGMNKTNKIMKKQDLKKVVDFYEKVICQQIIKPQNIQEIYNLVQPEGAQLQPYFKKMRAISVFVQGCKQEVLDELEELFEDFDEEQEEITNNPTLSSYVKLEMLDSLFDEIKSEDMRPEPKSEDEVLQKELNKLTSERSNATEANDKRSLTMKIKAINKKLGINAGSGS